MKCRDKTKCLCRHFQKWPLILGALLESLHQVLVSSENQAPGKLSQASRMRDCLKTLPWSCLPQHLSWVGVGCTSDRKQNCQRDCEQETLLLTSSIPCSNAMEQLREGFMCRACTQPFPEHTAGQSHPQPPPCQAQSSAQLPREKPPPAASWKTWMLPVGRVSLSPQGGSSNRTSESAPRFPSPFCDQSRHRGTVLWALICILR